MAIYYVYSGATGSNNGSSWANAFTTLTAAFVTEAAGDTLYVAHDHAESTAGAVTLTSSGTVANPTKIICVNRAGSVPPVSADRRATAQVSTTGNTNIVFAGTAHYDGLIFTAGNSTGAGSVNLLTTVSNTWSRFENCSLRCGSTGSLSKINAGASNSNNYIELNNTTLSFANSLNVVGVGSFLRWRNTASAILGTIPSVLFQVTGGSVDCAGVDVSAVGSGKTLLLAAGAIGMCRFVDCKLNASVTKVSTASPIDTNGMEIDFIRSGSSGVNYNVYSSRLGGALAEETTIIRTGGASDGTTGISWRIDTTANCTFSLPFECPPIAIWNDSTGSAVTATVEGIWGGGAVPNDDDVWLDVEYLGDASSPQGSFVNDGKADLLATAAGQTSSSETWGGSTTKFKLAVTFTAQQKGWIYARVKCAKASSTFYIDPLVTLT